MIERRSSLFVVLIAILFSVAGPSCGGGGEELQPPSPVGTGRLEGHVLWTEPDVPEPTRVSNATDPEICGAHQSLEDVAIDALTGGIAGVILGFAEVAPDRLPNLVPETLVIDNDACRFEPHVAVATVGTTLEARNSDPVLHTTHLYGPRESNISLPTRGARSSRTLTEPGLVVIKCDIHGWMQAFVRVDPHPFHDVTDVGGRFSIATIPPGSYRLEWWHERFGGGTRTVEIRAGETTRVELSFPSDVDRD